MNRIEELLAAIKQLRQDLDLAEHAQMKKQTEQLVIMKRLALKLADLPNDKQRKELIDLWVELNDAL